jgi:hypothetical protein
MAAAQQSTGEHRTMRERETFPSLAVLATFGAALAFAGVGAVTRSLGGDPAGMVAGAVVMALAGLVLLIPPARTGALLLTWNGLGIAVGMFVIGIFSVGALMIVPLVLIALALSSWPRREDVPLASWPAIVVQAGGFLLVLGLYGVLGTIADDVFRLAGG